MRHQVLEYDQSYLIFGGGISFVVNVLLFRFVSPVVSRCVTQTYRLLRKDEQEEWNDRFISNINALVSIILSGYCLFLETGTNEDKVWHDSPVARIACAVIVGYMLADVLCMLLWCKMKRGELFGFLFHHAATIYAYYFISAYGVLCYFGMLRLIAEMSTIPVNQRWYFDTTRYPRTRCIVIFNGFLMVLSFFIFRMVAMPVYWYQIWTVSGTEAATKLGHIQLIMYIPCFVLDCLNIVWFYKMCKGFVKAFKGILTEGGATDEKFKTV